MILYYVEKSGKKRMKDFSLSLFWTLWKEMNIKGINEVESSQAIKMIFF